MNASISKSIGLALCLVGGALSLSAQSYTLEECIALAIRNNPDYQTRVLQIERSRLQEEASKHAYLPTVQAGLGQSWDFGRSVDKTGVMSDRSSMGTSGSIGASYQLFSGFSRLYNMRAAKLQTEAAVANLAQARQELSVQVVQYYYALLHAQRVVEIAREQWRRSGEQRVFAEGMLQSGKWSRDRLAEAQAVEAESHQGVVQAENGVEVAKLNLRQLLLVDSIGLQELDRVKAFARADKMSLRGKALLDEAVAQRPALLANSYSIRAAEQQLRASRAGYMPSLSMSLGYSNNYYRILGNEYAAFNLPFREQIRQNGRSYIGLNLSIPIFDAFRTRTQVRQAQLNLRELQATRTNLTAQLRRELESAQLAAQLAKRKIEASRAAYEASRIAEEFAEGNWRVGRTTMNDLSQARNKSIVASLELLQAEYDYLLKAELLRYYTLEH